MIEQKPTGVFWAPLGQYLADTYHAKPTDADCLEIARLADKCRMASGPATWILVNALYCLDVDELKRLRDEIVKRIPEGTK